MNNETGNNINARNNCVLELSGIVKNYKQGKQTLEVLAGIDLAIRPREVTALVGQSGSGKSTLLQIAGLLDKPTAGRIFINGQNIGKASDDLRTQLRRDYIGFVYQYHNLLGDFSALENVMLPMLIAGRPKAEAAERAAFLLEKLHLSAGRQNFPAANNSGLRLHARWPILPNSCWQMSRPATLTQIRQKRFLPPCWELFGKPGWRH